MSAVLVLKRSPKTASSSVRCSARAAASAKRASSIELGHAQAAAQRLELLLGDRGDLEPAVARLVEAVARAEPRLVRVELRDGRALAVDEQHVGREHLAAVEQRRPQLLALAGVTLVVQRGEAPDDRQHRVGGVGHAEPVVHRRVPGVHRPRLVLEPGRRLEQRVEPAERGERSLEAVRVRVAVHDVGVDGLARRRSRCRDGRRRRRSCCGARCRRARRASTAISTPASALRFSAMSRLPR